MSVKRKHFRCGHVGFGKHCHRCEQAVEITDALKNKTKLPALHGGLDAKQCADFLLSQDSLSVFKAKS